MIKDFPNGVSFYSKAKAEVDIFFPEGKTVCRYCPYCYAEDSLERFRCRITPTFRIIANPFVERATFCPITEFEREE